MKMMLIMILLSSLLSACATTYQENGINGGFSERKLEDAIWRIRFSGNRYATKETIQTYWLYRCAEMALEKGYDGFEILSQIQFSKNMTPESFFEVQSSFRKTAVGGYISIPLYIGPSHVPHIEADVRFLKPPIAVAPPKVFDARELKAALDPLVKSEKKCSMGNICPHAHKYLFPKGTFENNTI